MKTKAYSYLRFSTPEQSKGDSFRRQLEAAKDIANKFNLDLDESLTFHDLGVSGFKGLNKSKGALGSFIRLVEDSQIDKGSWLIVESLDRLSREDPDTAMLQYLQLLNNGIVIYTASDNLKHEQGGNLQENTMRLTMSLMAMIRAHEESQLKSLRVSKAWASKKELARQGKVISSALPSWLYKEGEQILIDANKASTVKHIFELALKGMGQVAIANKFNRENRPLISNSPRSSQWHQSYINKILKNPAVYGEYQPMKGRGKDKKPDGEPIPEYFPAVIDKGTFYSLKAARSKKAPNTGKKGLNFSNLLQGIVKCQCGANMRYSNKGEGLVYLQCAKKTDGIKCLTPSFRYNHVFPAVIAKILQYNEALFAQLQDSSLEEDNLDNQIQALQEEKTDIKTNQGKVLDLMEGGLALEITMERLKQLEAKLENIDNEIEELNMRKASGTSPKQLQENYNSFIEIATFLMNKDPRMESYEYRVRLNSILKHTIESITFHHGDYFIIKLNDLEVPVYAYREIGGGLEASAFMALRDDNFTSNHITFLSQWISVTEKSYLEWRKEENH